MLKVSCYKIVLFINICTIMEILLETLLFALKNDDEFLFKIIINFQKSISLSSETRRLGLRN